jgi:transposase InsO family protein
VAAYDAVIAGLADPTVLVPFDSARTLFVVTDASELGASAIFMQLHADDSGAPTLRVVTATAMKFSKAELAYSAAEKELAALRHAHERFPRLMMGRTTVWMSDCAAMADLLAGTKITKKRRLLATVLDLVGTSIYSVHIAGRHNQLADYVSRNPAFRDTPAVAEQAPFSSTTVSLAALSAAPTALTAYDLAAEFRAICHLRDDEVTDEAAVVQAPVLAAVAAAPLPLAATPALKKATTRAVETALERLKTSSPQLLASVLELQDSDESLADLRQAAASGTSAFSMRYIQVPVGKAHVLFAFVKSQAANADRRLLLVIPQGLRRATLETMHAVAGCSGTRQMSTMVRHSVFWPHWARDVFQFVRSCDACARAREQRTAGNFGNSEQSLFGKPTAPAQVWQLDSWLLPNALADGGGVRVIGALDVYSGFVRLFRVPDATADSAARVLRQLRDAYGAMSAVYTDAGSEFKGEFARVAAEHLIHHHVGSVGNHTSAARIERTFRTLNDFVAKAFTHAAARGKSQLDDFDMVLAGAAESINLQHLPGASKLAVAATPFERFTGRKPTMPRVAAQVMLGVADGGDLEDSDQLSHVALSQFIVTLANVQSEAVESPPSAPDVAGRERARAAREAESAAATRRAHGKPLHVQPGDLVFINSPDAPRGKIARRVRARLGPFRVEHVDLQHGDQPLKVRVRLCVPIVGMSDEPLTVFVRDLTPCGSLPDLDPFGSVLPPSGFLVADLDPQRSQAAFDQLHTIFEQGLSIEERAHVRSLRARAVAASSTVGGRRLAGEPEQPVGPEQPWVPQAAPPQWMHEEWDDGLQDVPVDADEHDDDFADDRGYGASSDEDDDVDDKWDDAQSEWDGDSDGDSPADVGARAPVVQLSSPGLGSGMSSFDGIIEELSRVPSPEEEDIEDTQGVRRGPVRVGVRSIFKRY